MLDKVIKKKICCLCNNKKQIVNLGNEENVSRGRRRSGRERRGPRKEAGKQAASDWCGEFL